MSYHCSEDEVDTGILETRLMNRGFARRSCVPPHRTDAGTFLLAECYGCATHMLVKDVDGLYDDNPKAHPAANLIREITIGELKQRNLPTLPFDRVLVDLLAMRRLCTVTAIVW